MYIRYSKAVTAYLRFGVFHVNVTCLSPMMQEIKIQRDISILLIFSSLLSSMLLLTYCLLFRKNT